MIHTIPGSDNMWSIADEELIKDLTSAGYIVKENDGKKTKRKTGE